jgi:hypothetical protein
MNRFAYVIASAPTPKIDLSPQPSFHHTRPVFLFLLYQPQRRSSRGHSATTQNVYTVNQRGAIARHDGGNHRHDVTVPRVHFDLDNVARATSTETEFVVRRRPSVAGNGAANGWWRAVARGRGFGATAGGESGAEG